MNGSAKPPSRSEGRRGTSRPIGRVLSSRCRDGRPSIYDCRCRQPQAVYPQARAGRPQTPAQRHRTEVQQRLLDLAPGGVYRAARVTPHAGGLLHHRFTLTPRTPTQIDVRESGLFSVALSRGSPRVGVTHHLALWSPDLPRHAPEGAQRGRPADSSAVPATVDGHGETNSSVRVAGSAVSSRTSMRSPNVKPSPLHRARTGGVRNWTVPPCLPVSTTVA
jgi:hypothetical protein